MESLSVHLMWVAAATYCAMLAPKNLLATLIGVLGMAHFSLGKKLFPRHVDLENSIYFCGHGIKTSNK